MIQQISSKKTFEKPLSEEKADDTQSGVLGFLISALTAGQPGGGGFRSEASTPDIKVAMRIKAYLVVLE